jgi:hypothetical protein
MQHRVFLRTLTLWISILAAATVQADLLCLKTTAKSAKKGKIAVTNSITTVGSNAVCPKGYKLLFDSSSLTGASGPQGPSGLDGQLRVYGDGSRGDLTVGNGELVVLDTPNMQFNNISVEAGGTLQIPSGATVRCLGQFQNAGYVYIQTGAQWSSHMATPSDQTIPTTPSYFGNQAFTAASDVRETSGPSYGSIQGPAGVGAGGTIGGILPNKARTAIRPAVLGGGAGGNSSGPGGEGGGFAAILCQGAIVNSNVLGAYGGNAGSVPGNLIGGGGGGAGGIIVLASRISITNSGLIEAVGGNGAPAASAIIADQATAWGPGGGGGGGIIHLLAPAISSTGSLNVNAGSAGATASLVAYPSASLMTSVGGGGGGSCYGTGGNGGISNGNVLDRNFWFGTAQGGASGLVLQTLADPTSLF